MRQGVTKSGVEWVLLNLQPKYATTFATVEVNKRLSKEEGAELAQEIDGGTIFGSRMEQKEGTTPGKYTYEIGIYID